MFSFLPGNVIDVFCRDGEFGFEIACDSAAERIRVVPHTGGQFEAIHRVFFRRQAFFPWDQPNRIGSTPPSPKTKSHSAGAGVPTGRVRRVSRAAMRGSSKSHSAWRRSNARNTTAVAAP